MLGFGLMEGEELGESRCARSRTRSSVSRDHRGTSGAWELVVPWYGINRTGCQGQVGRISNCVRGKAVH